MPKPKHDVEPSTAENNELKLDAAPSVPKTKIAPVLDRDLPMVDAKGQRLSLALTESGELDLERTRETGVAKLKKALSNPTIKAQLGLVKQDVVEKKDAERLLDMLGGIESLVATWAMRCEPKIVEQVIPFSEIEKAKLAPALTDVLNKHVDAIPQYLKYKEEISLIVQLGLIERQKFTELRKMQTEFTQTGHVPKRDGVTVLRVSESKPASRVETVAAREFKPEV
jgi:hypothetical protein